MLGKKRVLAVIMTLIMILGMLAPGAFAEEQDVCEIEGGSQYATLDEALSAVQNGQTIRLLASIPYDKGISISNKQITFNLNSFNLSVVNTSGDGLIVENNGAVNLTGFGEFNVTGTGFGVKAMTGGTATVTNATATGDTGRGVLADGGSVTVRGNAISTGDYGYGAVAWNGGSVTVEGNAGGITFGAGAWDNGSSVTVGGNVTATGAHGRGAAAYEGGNVTVGGNAIATGTSSYGAFVNEGGNVTVGGNAEGVFSGAAVWDGGSVVIRGNAKGILYYGVNAWGNGSSITVEGNVMVEGNNSVGANAEGGGNVTVKGNVTAEGSNSFGAFANGGEITIDGSISASRYIKTGSVVKGENDFETVTTKTGYRTFTDGTSTVWVKAAGVVYVCEIEGGSQYATLDEALSAAQNGQTIRLLASIPYDKGISISNKQITFNLNSFNLNVVNISGDGLIVENNGAINLSGVGEFNVTGRDFGVRVLDGGTATVTNATATETTGKGAFAKDDESSVTVGGNATATGSGGIGARAEYGGSITVEGNAEGTNNIGAYAEYGGSVTVGGNATGSNSTGAAAKNGGSVTVEGNAEGILYGAAAWDGGSVTVGGNATAEGSSQGAGAAAYGGSSVTVGGNVTVTGSNGIGAFAFNAGSVTVNGSITATTYIKTGSVVKGIDDYEIVTTKPGYRTYTDGTSIVWVKAAAPPTPTFTLTLVANPDAGGTVTDNTNAGPYQAGTTVNVTATANSGYRFTNWTVGDLVVSTSTTFYYTMPAQNVTLTANFIAVSPGGSSSGGDGGTPTLAIDKTNPSDGTVGTVYNHTFTATGGSKPYTFTLTGGTLPEGMSLSKDGTLSGTPAAPGTYTFAITVSDSNGRTSSHTFTFVIKEGPPVPAPVPQKTIILTVGILPATVDGQPYMLNAEPFIDKAANRTLVPIRFISEALGAEVDWIAETQQVVIRDGDQEIVLTIGSRDVLLNGVKQTIDCAPVVIPPGRTFVPLRFISETLGATVDYDSATGRITITR